MKVTLESGQVVNTDIDGWGVDLSDSDYELVSMELDNIAWSCQFGNCRCPARIEEDLRDADNFMNRQLAREERD